MPNYTIDTALDFREMPIAWDTQASSMTRAYPNAAGTVGRLCECECEEDSGQDATEVIPEPINVRDMFENASRLAEISGSIRDAAIRRPTPIKKKLSDNSANNKCCMCGKKGKFDFICDNCSKIFFTECDRCHRMLDKYLIYNVENKNFCCYCLSDIGARKCQDCGCWSRELFDVKDVGIICKSCFTKDKYFRCKSCGCSFKNDRKSQDGNCISCINRNLEEVNNYSYKPEPKFYNSTKDDKDDKLYFGVEIELGGVDDYETVNEFAKECASRFFYMKKDTSIPVYGCEVVTQPATLQRHLSMGGWENLLETANRYGLRADLEKCGIHIHISREFFTNEECSKMDCFVNTYKNFWKKLARRESHYSTYVQKRYSAWGMQTTDRRCALNLSNPHTVEMRIFKGSTDYKVVMAYIELCHALSFFVKKISMEDIVNNSHETLKVFEEIVYNNNYKHLPEYCENTRCFIDE